VDTEMDIEMIGIGLFCFVMGGLTGFVVGMVRGWRQTDDLYARMAEESLLRMSRRSNNS
jgi:hypothetical protein